MYRTAVSQVWLEKFLPSSRYSWAHKDSEKAVSLPAESFRVASQLCWRTRLGILPALVQETYC